MTQNVNTKSKSKLPDKITSAIGVRTAFRVNTDTNFVNALPAPKYILNIEGIKRVHYTGYALHIIFNDGTRLAFRLKQMVQEE